MPFAATNFLGPVLLGRLFDTLGRRVMIAGCYALSGILLVICGALFFAGWFNATTQTIGWMVVFFFASPAASAAYLTVSETFPLEMRALAIAVFYAIGTGIGGVAAPIVFGWLIESGSRGSVFAGYAFAAALMGLAALVAARYAVRAERKPLEEVADADVGGLRLFAACPATPPRRSRTASAPAAHRARLWRAARRGRPVRRSRRRR